MTRFKERQSEALKTKFFIEFHSVCALPGVSYSQGCLVSNTFDFCHKYIQRSILLINGNGLVDKNIKCNPHFCNLILFVIRILAHFSTNFNHQHWCPAHQVSSRIIFTCKLCGNVVRMLMSSAFLHLKKSVISQEPVILCIPFLFQFVGQ